jgi:hypothetical protein
VQDAIEFIGALRCYGRGDACRRLKVILSGTNVAFLNANGYESGFIVRASISWPFQVLYEGEVYD